MATETNTFAYWGTGKALHKVERCAGRPKHGTSKLTEDQARVAVEKHGMTHCQKCWEEEA